MPIRNPWLCSKSRTCKRKYLSCGELAFGRASQSRFREPFTSIHSPTDRLEAWRWSPPSSTGRPGHRHLQRQLSPARETPRRPQRALNPEQVDIVNRTPRFITGGPPATPTLCSTGPLARSTSKRSRFGFREPTTPAVNEGSSNCRVGVRSGSRVIVASPVPHSACIRMRP